MTTPPAAPAFAVFVDPSAKGSPAIEVARTLSMAGFEAIEVSDLNELRARRPDHGWAGTIVQIDAGDPAGSWGFCRDARRTDETGVPTLVLIGGSQLSELAERHEQFDDFLLSPFHPSEMEARLRHLLWRSGRGPGPELVELGPLTLNLETYQATLLGRPLDLTYMEYELLKFLALSPGKVFSREVLLNRVWGYEYYGGARTVDVHVRRLRAKFGEEHAHMIQTVRSVGYKLDR